MQSDKKMKTRDDGLENESDEEDKHDEDEKKRGKEMTEMNGGGRGGGRERQGDGARDEKIERKMQRYISGALKMRVFIFIHFISCCFLPRRFPMETFS